MYTELDHQLMSRALALAQRALYHATPNPRVGCVIARDGRVLGEGWTQPPGSNHAEVEALLDDPNLATIVLAATDEGQALRANNPFAGLFDRAERNAILAAATDEQASA